MSANRQRRLHANLSRRAGARERVWTACSEGQLAALLRIHAARLLHRGALARGALPPPPDCKSQRAAAGRYLRRPTHDSCADSVSSASTRVRQASLPRPPAPHRRPSRLRSPLALLPSPSSTSRSRWRSPSPRCDSAIATAKIHTWRSHPVNSRICSAHGCSALRVCVPPHLSRLSRPLAASREAVFSFYAGSGLTSSRATPGAPRGGGRVPAAWLLGPVGRDARGPDAVLGLRAERRRGRAGQGFLTVPRPSWTSPGAFL